MNRFVLQLIGLDARYNFFSCRIGPPGEWAAKYTRVAQEWGHARQKKNLSHLILRNWKIAKL